MTPPKPTYGFRQQQGAAAVEFAVVASLFFVLLLGIMEFGRMLYIWNAADQATRVGARLAVVCNLNDAIIKSSMQKFLPGISTTDINVAYSPSGCLAYASPGSPSTPVCDTVTVEISNTAPSIRSLIPYLNLAVKIPKFSTSLPREFMTSANNQRCTNGMS